MAKTKLSPEQKAANLRERLLEDSKRFGIGTYRGKVAKVFQKMVRAEAGALPACNVVVMVNGELSTVFRNVGQCVCVTCGRVTGWKGVGVRELDTGHFIASRRSSIVFEPTNSHPQCKGCNKHLGGNQGLYAIWMRHVYGQEEIDRLTRLKNTTVQFTKEQLVDMKIAFAARLKAAEKIISS